MYIRFRTLPLGVPRQAPGSPTSEKLGSEGGSKNGTADEWRLRTMTTEIINLTGVIGQWLNLLVARRIAAQAAKLPH